MDCRKYVGSFIVLQAAGLVGRRLSALHIMILMSLDLAKVLM